MNNRHLTARLAEAEARELERQTIVSERQVTLVVEAVTNAADELELPEEQRTRLIRSVARHLRLVDGRDGASS